MAPAIAHAANCALSCGEYSLLPRPRPSQQPSAPQLQVQLATFPVTSQFSLHGAQFSNSAQLQRQNLPCTPALGLSNPLRLGRTHSNNTEFRRGVLCQAGSNAVASDDYYGLLGVSRNVDKADLKRAYRKLALVFHPDVNKDEGAQDSFVALSTAYEVLVDDEQRKLYDRYGAEGLRRQPNKSSGSAWEVWDEFKPMKKKKSRKQTARDAAADASTSGREGDTENDGPAFAQSGDVVEFPLSEAARVRMNDGREKGVGFVVGRNIDRGDKHKLSPENLTLCEVEVLWQEDGDDRWTVDPMESSAFADLLELRVLRSEFDRLSDSWKILDELSPGCGSPQYAEEVIL